MFTKARTTMVGAALLLLGGAACTDITTEPRSTVTGANVFNDPGAYRSFLARLYAGLAVTGQQGPAGNGDIQGIDEGFSHYLRLLWQMQELPTEEAVIAWNDGSLRELNTQLWTSSNEFLGAMYSRIFFQVSLANEFLRETEDGKLSERGVSDALRGDIQQYRAEARFLRALSYWHGVDFFGDIPLVTEADALGATPPQQSTREAVFAFVVEELNAIRDQLPPAGAGEYGRADQAAVDMVLGKLYLNAGVYTSQERYGEALAAVERIINSGAFELDDVYQHLFLADNHTSPELIFAIPQDGQFIQSYGGTTFLAHAGVGGAMDPIEYGLNFGWWGLRVTPEFVGLYPEGANGSDERSDILFSEGQSVPIPNLTVFTDGLAAPKYKNITSAGLPGSDLEFVDIDYPMFRLGDAYLMYAEAVLRGGGGSRAQALEYVNELRARAETDLISDGQLTLDFILAERGRELYWEGHRRTDLIRFNRFAGGDYLWAWKGGIQAGQPTAECRAIYPLPASELLANPNLTQTVTCQG